MRAELVTGESAARQAPHKRKPAVSRKARLP